MSNVIPFPSKENDGPHITGPAVCLHCKHTWQVVAPVGVISLQCPECLLEKGVLQFLCLPDEFWQCACGNATFYITRAGVGCYVCGKTQVFK